MESRQTENKNSHILN